MTHMETPEFRKYADYKPQDRTATDLITEHSFAPNPVHSRQNYTRAFQVLEEAADDFLLQDCQPEEVKTYMDLKRLTRRWVEDLPEYEDETCTSRIPRGSRPAHSVGKAISTLPTILEASRRRRRHRGETDGRD